MLDSIISVIKHSAISVSELIKLHNSNYLSSTNSTGDMQLELDVESNNIFKNALFDLNFIKGICSEEESEIIYVNEDGIYIVAFDPLDGSSIINSNLSVGSIFGIYNNSLSAKNLIASGYIIYGPRLELVVAQNEVYHYFYDSKEWRLISNISLKEQGKINSPGGTQQHWSITHKILMESFFQEGYRLRYSGGMVPDLHNILVKGGGLFSYPATSDTPKGKLRVFFEVLPFAMIFERAGGGAISGIERLLDLEFSDIHATTPCFFGSNNEIERVKQAYIKEIQK